MLIEIIKRIKYWNDADRIGPDMLSTHWRLYFKSTMLELCKKKFNSFDDTAEVRPGAYAMGCSQIKIGKQVVIRPGTKLFGETKTLEVSITIEDDVLIGSGVQIYVENHRFDTMDVSLIEQGCYDGKPVFLRRGCWLGANVIILPGVEIGENSVVGAGSIVTRSIPSGVVVAGNPAKLIKYIGENFKINKTISN